LHESSWARRISFLFTEDNKENKDRIYQGPDPVENLKRDIFAFAVYLICSGQNHSRNAVFENRLMEIDQQADWNIQQFHIAEELRFAGRMQNLDRF
jgi:hypothetical protein